MTESDCSDPLSGSGLGGVRYHRDVLHCDLPDSKAAAAFLERAFDAARLLPPPGLSPTYRPDCPPAAEGVALGYAGLPWVQALGLALLELSYLRGDLHAVAGGFPGVRLIPPTGEYLEELGLIPASNPPVREAFSGSHRTDGPP